MPTYSGAFFTSGTLLFEGTGNATLQAIVVPMMSTLGQCYKILNTVISTVSIYMMDFLAFFKSPFVLFPHQKVFSDISIPVCLRVFMAKNHPITARINSLPTFPSMMGWAGWKRVMAGHIKLAIFAFRVFRFPHGSLLLICAPQPHPHGTNISAIFLLMVIL